MSAEIKYLIQQEKLSSLANAIRGKTGENNQLSFDEMVGEISDLSVLNTEDATATASDLLENKTAYVNGEKITGTIPIRTSSNVQPIGGSVSVTPGYYQSQVTCAVNTSTLPTPSIVIGSDGKVTVSVALKSSGYIVAGTKSIKKQLPTQAEQTIIPNTSDQTIAAETYLTGTQTIKGDTNLVAENIKEGVTIFGVQGTHVGGNTLECSYIIGEVAPSESVGNEGDIYFWRGES